ncbi:MAG TPA: hypothetical protein VMT83_04745 [Burkholderiaceae bacterium]|nr:hypothetical protein [Burkholderiaceae bacterium]
MTTTRCRLLLAALPALIAGAVAAAPPTTIVDLQPARRSDGVVLRDAAGRAGSATLTQLNPVINAWLLLTLQSPGRSEMASYHLENADPPGQRIALDAEQPGQLVITRSGVSARCTFWPGNALQEAHRSVLPYAPLCDGRLYLRNTVPGNRSTLEATTEFLRDHVWRGEQIIGFVRREFYPDAFAERATPASAAAELTPAGPPGARVLAGAASRPVTAEGLALDLGQGRAGLVIGRWYAVAGLDGVYASVAQPRALQALPGPALDAVEAEALAYLVAFDLAHFELGFALGTEHPRLGWSARVRDDMRDPALPGPDGIADAAPLVRNGMVGPRLQARTVATFTGGFKREHGAFAHGALAAVNRGSHYGFIEQGVVFSSLVPGLATLFVLDDGEVDMKTWTREDQHLLGRIRHARQNGVPLLERDPRGGAAVPGALLDQWGAGNWSGSADERLRTLRAGACLVDDGTRRFLVYGYFSTATPRAMAQVFLAYGCRYAMHLDMNALEHTYLALYPRSGAQVGVEHLVKGMEVLDKRVHGALVPRFLGFADDRDFFYLVSRKGTR